MATKTKEQLALELQQLIDEYHRLEKNIDRENAEKQELAASAQDAEKVLAELNKLPQPVPQPPRKHPLLILALSLGLVAAIALLYLFFQ